VFRQKLSVDVLETVNRTMGLEAQAYLEQLPIPPADQEGAIVVATADGKGVPLVPSDARKIPAFEAKELPGNRRMAILGCMYTVDPYVRTPEQIVAALFRDDAVEQPPDRPSACFKRYRACFSEAAPEAADAGEAIHGEDAVHGAYRTWTWMAEQVTSRCQSGQTVVRLMDGRSSLWDASDACMAEFADGLRAAGESDRLVDILDVIHVSGYVRKAAKAFYSHKEQREAFVQDRLLRILQGDVAGVILGMRRMASLRGLTGEAKKDVAT